MSDPSHLDNCTRITEIAQITSQLQTLKRRAKELEVPDLPHLLEVSEHSANQCILKILEEMQRIPMC